jgi:hypothetical protein
MKRYIIVITVFLFVGNNFAIGQITPRSSIEAHLGEPFYLSYSHPISSKLNLRFNIGLGGIGLFYTTDYQKRYESHNYLYSGRSRIFVMNTSVRYSLPVLFKRKLGWIVQTGFQFRFMPWLSVYTIDRKTMNVPKNPSMETIPFLQTGMNYKISPKIEIGVLSGVGVNIVKIRGTKDFIWSVYTGFEF